MKKIKLLSIIRIVGSALFILFSTQVFAEYVLTDEQYNAIIKQLEQDQKLINNNNIIWSELRKSKPKITYEIIEDQVVIQSIEIPIYKSKPIVYEVKFKVDQKIEPTTYFPFTLLLCGMVETVALADFKFGVQLFSLYPLQIIVLRNIGLNVLVGIKSSGISISYGLPKPLRNTSIHIYTGLSYTTTKEVFGMGVSLNF